MLWVMGGTVDLGIDGLQEEAGGLSGVGRSRDDTAGPPAKNLGVREKQRGVFLLSLACFFAQGSRHILT